MSDDNRKHAGAMRDRFKEEKHHRPAAAICDYYKLLYQAAFGMEHLICDPGAFFSYLQQETSLIKPDPAMPLLEPITVFNPIARINLAALLASGITIEQLSDYCVIFLDTFEKIETCQFREMMHIFSAVLVSPPWSFPRESVEAFVRMLPDDHYPAIHHSVEYRRIYAPHYRLIHPDMVDKIHLNV